MRCLDDIRNCSELYDKDEYHYSWWGAMLLAKRLVAILSDDGLKNVFGKSKNTVNLLNFLLKSKSDMLNFIYHDGSVVKLSTVKDKKGRVKEYIPYRLAWESGTPIGTAKELDFISPHENKWRDTAKLLMYALNNACAMLGVFTGRAPNDIFNELLCGKEIETPSCGANAADGSTDDICGGNITAEISDTPPPKKKDKSIVLDFYSGSATTAHAVMQLNAEDGGDRNFIMVQLPEACKESSEAYKAGYKNICEIGKERIRRAAKKIAEENPGAEFDSGFKCFKIGDKKSGENAFIPDDGTLSDADILTAAINAAGLPPHTGVRDIEILGARFRIVGDNDIIIAENPGTTMEQAAEIIKMHPKNIMLINAADDVIALITKYSRAHSRIYPK